MVSTAAVMIWTHFLDKQQALVTITVSDAIEANQRPSLDLVEKKETPSTNIATNNTSIIDNITSTQELKLIASQHEQVLRYPPYSQPILDKESPFLDWNHFEEVPAPVLDGKHTSTLSLKKYRHFFPDEIEVNLKSSLGVMTALLDVEDVVNKKKLATFSMKEYGWRIVPKSDWPEELRLVAHVSFGQGDDVISADLRLYHSVARIIEVGSSSSNNTDMIIPIKLQIDKAGIYRVRANLYQFNGSPVASLIIKQYLSEGEQTVDLRAFHRVLTAGESEYELRDIMIERMSGFPGEKAQYGRSQKIAYPIGLFDSSILSNEPYTMSDKERQQLDFLNHKYN